MVYLKSIINTCPFSMVAFSFASTDIFFNVTVYIVFFLKKQNQAAEHITLF